MIETKKLRKVFGPIEAVKGVSFRMNQGEVLGFLGPNGAGKSTVMRMLTCFLTPTSGTASVAGHDIIEESMEVRKIVGYLPESNPVYGDMSVVEFLKFIGEMRGYKGGEIRQRMDRVIEMCWLGNVRHQMLDTLSKGFKRRVGLAQALIHDPAILILDEPTDGLDPNQKHEVRTLIRQMASTKAIIISTHILEEVESVCTRAIIIDEGRIKEDKSPGELLTQSRYHGAVQLALLSSNGPIKQSDFSTIPGLGEVEAIDTDGPESRFVLFPKNDANIVRDVLSLVSTKGWKVEDINVERGDMNEVFRDITNREGAHS
ncbi:MAG: ABC transporter ATP-binding protein [Candidatus Sumerlaeia bacterium]